MPQREEPDGRSSAAPVENPCGIYGDGCQVRDALFVGDAVAAWRTALDRIDRTSGRIFNIGGGPENAVSLRELLSRIGDMHGERPQVRYQPARPGDQPWYVSNIAQASRALGWRPATPFDDGLLALDRWLGALAGFVRAAPASREARL